MKKYKMMALTGILLSSTILGANTSIIQAASTTSKTESSSANPIQVINALDDLLTSTTTNKVNAQTQFSDLVDGSNVKAAPIFGKQTSAEFANTLQSELNVVNSSKQLVPMTVVKSNTTTGFAEKVSYTLDGTTKTVSVNYNFALPRVTGSQYMNFSSKDTQANLNTALSATGSTDNGTDANGNTNSVSVSASPNAIKSTDASTDVKLTPSDNYAPGNSITRTVNVYQEPDWSSIKRTTDAAGLKVPTYYTKDGQTSRLDITNASDYKPGETFTPEYKATAISSNGRDVTDSVTKNAITFTSKDSKNAPAPITIDSTNLYYTIVFRDANSGRDVYSVEKSATGTTATVSGSEITKDLPDGKYTLAKTPDDSYTFDADDATKTFDVNTKADTTINYIDTAIKSDKPVSTETLSGNDGSTLPLASIPEGYQLNSYSDLIQTLNADQPTKDVYVTPLKSIVKDLGYTVTFKDKDTGKTVGTAVNGTGNLGDYIGVTAPDGYVLSTLADNGFLLFKNGQNVTKYVTAANTPYNISYVDNDSNEEVGTQAGKGADGAKVTLTSPKGYTFTNANDIYYTIDKDTPNAKVYVTKDNDNSAKVVSTYPDGGYVKIYDENGKLNDDVVISKGTDWVTDQTKTIDGVQYYRVATNQYIKASSAYTYEPMSNVVTTPRVTPVYNSKGQLVVDLVLDKDTPWYTDRSARLRGVKMYRVATDEWVKSGDVNLY